MKKILCVLLILFMVSGCSIKRMDNLSIDSLIEETLYKETDLYNQNKIGYRYYLPRTWAVISDIDYNESFKEGNNKYYLYVDVVSYYNKIENSYTKNEDAYYSQALEYDGKNGYIEITKVEDYFLVEMMYNYSKVEVMAREKDLTKVISGASNILSSIKYNNSVLENLLGENKLSFEEISYDISKPNNGNNGKTFLDYVEEYEGEYDALPEDSDVIN